MQFFKNFEDAVVADVQNIVERIQKVTSDGIEDVESFFHAKTVLIQTQIESIRESVKNLVKLGVADVAEVEQEIKDHVLALEKYFSNIGQSAQGLVDSLKGK